MRHYVVSAFIVALAGAGVISTAHAKDGYGTAGCGLGSILFGNEPGIVQVLAATTNGTFGTQTFGISSGTSNCVDTAGGGASTKAFIQANREVVAKEIARGSGETISSISTLAGCANAAAVGSTLQSEFKSIFPNEQVSDIAVSDAVVNTLQAHPELACRSIS
ncbi:MAG TPA: DUF3015 family protein [Polyangiales bacterium]|nr:DUF3015 family protein [Polyangiales bacterium]